MSDTSNTVPAEGTTSPTGFDRDLLFYTSATFVLEPDNTSSTTSADAVKRVALKLDSYVPDDRHFPEALARLNWILGWFVL